MKRKIRRVLAASYQVFVFGFLIYIVATPWIRDYSLVVFEALPKRLDLIVLAVLLTIVELLGIALLVKRKPWPYALSQRTVWQTWREKRRTGETFKEAFQRMQPGDGFYEFNAPFAPLETPYLWILFVPLIYMSLPYLATLEEILFRSYGNTLPAVLLFSALFAIVHIPSGFRVYDLMLSFGLALLFAAFYISEGLHSAVLFHVAINVIGVGVLIWQKVFWPDLKKLVGEKEWYRKADAWFTKEMERST